MSRVAAAIVEEVSIKLEQVLQRRIEYRKPRDVLRKVTVSVVTLF